MYFIDIFFFRSPIHIGHKTIDALNLFKFCAFRITGGWGGFRYTLCVLLVVIVELHIAGGLYKVLLALVTVGGHLAVLVHLNSTLLPHN